MHNGIVTSCYCYVQINKRGVAPLGGGEVLFSCPTKQKLRPIQFTDAGKVRRIRGVAYPFWLWCCIYLYTCYITQLWHVLFLLHVNMQYMQSALFFSVSARASVCPSNASTVSK